MGFDLGDIIDVGAAVVTGGASLQYVAAKKAINAVTSTPNTLNSRGDTLSDADKAALDAMSPQQRAIDMRNWLTVGGPPKPIDPSQIFAEDQVLSPTLRRSAAGQGINSLFGVGNLIGNLQPVQPIKPLNLSPMQPGVPYSVPPVPGIGGPR